MDYQLIVSPVVGAVIGCFTNYIAVRMMFRPHNEVKIGKFTVPFTPGIIPRGRARLAKAVGDAVGKNLLTEESFEESLLAPTIESHLKEKVRRFLYENRKNEKTLREALLEYVDEPLYESGVENVTRAVTDRLVKKILEMEVGTLIADQAAVSIREKFGGGLMSLFMTDGVIESLKTAIGDEINRYLEEHVDELLGPRIKAECMAAMDTSVGSIAAKIDDCDLPLDEILWNGYAALVKRKMGAALRRLDISGMIEKKINEMDAMEVEELVLSVMKKELNAVVWLGAVIGFVMGFFGGLF